MLLLRMWVDPPYMALGFIAIPVPRPSPFYVKNWKGARTSVDSTKASQRMQLFDWVVLMLVCGCGIQNLLHGAARALDSRCEHRLLLQLAASPAAHRPTITPIGHGSAKGQEPGATANNHYHYHPILVTSEY